jgi:hypothetical protein
VSAGLETHYRRAEYCVQIGARPWVFTPRRYEPAAETALIAHAGEFRHWAIVTPCNPASAALCAQENAARLENFRHWLQASPYRWLDSRNRDPDGAWPDEPGALILDIPLAEAETIGRHFGQNAIVYGQRNSAPELVWLVSSPDPQPKIRDSL